MKGTKNEENEGINNSDLLITDTKTGHPCLDDYKVPSKRSVQTVKMYRTRVFYQKPHFHGADLFSSNIAFAEKSMIVLPLFNVYQTAAIMMRFKQL